MHIITADSKIMNLCADITDIIVTKFTSVFRTPRTIRRKKSHAETAKSRTDALVSFHKKILFGAPHSDDKLGGSSTAFRQSSHQSWSSESTSNLDASLSVQRAERVSQGCSDKACKESPRSPFTDSCVSERHQEHLLSAAAQHG